MFTDTTLKGKRILITGGGSGLGLSMADHFCRLGADVAICGRTEEKLKKAAEQLSRHGTKVFTHVADVRDAEGVEAMIERLNKEMGQINVLVNNAAGNFLAASEELSANAFRSVVDIVLQGSFNCTMAVGRSLIEANQDGSILNIVTTYTKTGSSFVLPSACAKAGVEAMTKTLAFEWATYGIRCNAIAPGPFPTEGAWQRLLPDKDMENFYKKRIPVGRFGEHKELANLASFLVSDLSPFINGEVVTIDGGESLQGGQFNFVAQMMPRQQLKAMFAMAKKGAKKD